MPTVTMDFFEHQEQARRKTTRLVFYFVLAVASMVVVIYVLLAAFFLHPRSGSKEGPGRLWEAKFFLCVAGGTVAVIAAGSLLKINELSSGGSTLAMRLGGLQVDSNTTDPDERKLINVVEEMAIASGIPVPAVFVLQEQKSINAFAAGHSTGDATVGVTRGSMKLLTRDELQGVIAHEFSHILNGDMRLNMRLIGILYGILCLTIIGRILLRTRGRKNPLPLVGLVLIVMGGIGFFFGRLIKAAVSRQREFLADAAAVQFTRNPDGLAGALKKIGGLAWGSRVDAEHAEEASHLFFGNAVGGSWFNFWTTHPPLQERIRRIDPNFDGKFARVAITPELSPVELARPAEPSQKQQWPLPPVIGVLTAGSIPAARILSGAGSPRPEHLRYAAGLLENLPDRLKAAAHEPFDANALVFALLLSADEAVRAAQLREMEVHTGAAMVQATNRLFTELGALERAARLALVELALPALRRLSPEQFEQFSATVHVLTETDQGIDLFEYALQKMLLRHLAPHFTPSSRPIVQYYALKPVMHECSVLLSALARLGNDDPEQVQTAFRQGARQFQLAEGELTLVKFEECNLPQIDAALERLTQLAPPLKRLLLHACAHAVASDGVIQSKEAELLRAVADTLDCPVPPFIESGAQ